MVNAFGDLAVKSHTTFVLGEENSLHVRQPDNGRGCVLLTNDEGGTAGVGLHLEDQGGPKQLGFWAVEGTEAPPLLLLGTVHGIQFPRGIRLSIPKYADANVTLTSAEALVYADAGSGGITLTLPSAADNDGRLFYVYKVDGAGDVDVEPDGSELINGANASKTFSTQWSGLLLFAMEANGGWVATELVGA